MGEIVQMLLYIWTKSVRSCIQGAHSYGVLDRKTKESICISSDVVLSLAGMQVYHQKVCYAGCKESHPYKTSWIETEADRSWFLRRSPVISY